jgi:hypothetical protein
MRHAAVGGVTQKDTTGFAADLAMKPPEMESLCFM